MKHHAKHQPSLAKEIEQLKAYKGLAAKGAQVKLAELEKKFAELKAQGREAEAYVEPKQLLKPTIVKPSGVLGGIFKQQPKKEEAKPAAPAPAEQPKADDKKRRRK